MACCLGVNGPWASAFITDGWLSETEGEEHPSKSDGHVQEICGQIDRSWNRDLSILIVQYEILLLSVYDFVKKYIADKIPDN